jgi:membrane-associated protein
MDLLQQLIDFILHLDVHLAAIVSTYGLLSYLILFAIIFMETGLVVTPFLPGDSLLFAAGTIAALGALNIWLLAGLLIAAAILGDTVNYWIGNYIGPKAYAADFRFLKREHLDRTHAFFEKHGGKAIILARFVPIVRTFAPFVAGIGSMSYGKFLSFNVIGGVAWVLLFLLAGYFFGQLPFVKENFELIVPAIILLSLVPILYEFVRNRLHPAAEQGTSG